MMQQSNCSCRTRRFVKIRSNKRGTPLEKRIEKVRSSSEVERITNSNSLTLSRLFVNSFFFYIFLSLSLSPCKITSFSVAKCWPSLYSGLASFMAIIFPSLLIFILSPFSNSFFPFLIPSLFLAPRRHLHIPHSLTLSKFVALHISWHCHLGPEANYVSEEAK